MLAFVMALKPKAVSHDWARVSRLCEAAVLSAYQQVNPDIKIILVCNEVPEFQTKFDDRLEIISVNLAAPTPGAKNAMLDKWRKIAIGLVRAGELKPDFVMLMDADDLVSNRINDHAAAHSQSNGWIIHRGYHYTYGSRWIEAVKNYNCGTNAIVAARNIVFPSDDSEAEQQRCVLLTAGHTIIDKVLRERGCPLEELPFEGGIYIVDHGDNWTVDPNRTKNLFRRLGIRTKLRKLPRMRWLGAGIRREFAVDALLKA